jgi:malonate-semialdehyde dehydrogenase (acetylating)/methylmalonate-semialdehyde dehydrogenase
VHGGRQQVDALLTHRDVKAISFVGSVPVAQHVYRTGTQHLKRVQAMAGAKNHMVIMPDANKEQVISNLIGASCGAAGQRCMAISVAVFVSAAKEWIPKCRRHGKVAPVLDARHPHTAADQSEGKGTHSRFIRKAKRRRHVCWMIDCRSPAFRTATGSGPTLFTDIDPNVVYKEEISGPVLLAAHADLDAAIGMINESIRQRYVIFTSGGGAASKFQHEIEVGQVGINVPIPCRCRSSFTGWKQSFFGDQHAYGKQAVRFYTETKTVTARWFDESSAVFQA